MNVPRSQKMPVTRDFSKFSGRLTPDVDSDDSLASVNRSIAVSGGKAKTDSSDDDSSSETELRRKSVLQREKLCATTKGLSAEWKTHIEQSDRELTPGCIIMFYLVPPHGRLTGNTLIHLRKEKSQRLLVKSSLERWWYWNDCSAHRW